MSDHSNVNLVRFHRFMAFVFGLLSTVAGITVLIGWQFQIESFKTVFLGVAAMKALSALACVMLGTALMLQSGETPSYARSVTCRFLAGIVVLIALATIAEYLSSSSLHVDRFLFHDTPTTANPYPGRMSLGTAATFLLIALALFTIDIEGGSGHRPSQWLAAPAAIVSLLALIGFSSDVSVLYSPSRYSWIALHTALILLLLALGTLLARTGGWMRLFNSELLGGTVARRLLPPAVFLPFLLGWLRVKGQDAGLYNAGFGRALYAILLTIVFMLLVWSTARHLDRMEFEKLRIAEEKFKLEADLVIRERDETKFRALLEAVPDAVVVVDSDGKLVLVNAQAEKIYGYSRQEMLGQPAEMLVPERLRARFRLEQNEFLIDPQLRAMEDKRTRNFFCLHKDGHEFPAEINLGPMQSEEGLLVSAIIRDVTQRQKTSDELLNQTRLLAAIVEQMGEGLVVADARGKFLIFNQAAAHILGSGPVDDMPPENWSAHFGVFLPDQQTPFPADRLPLARAMRGESVPETEIWLRRSAELAPVWITATAQPLYDTAGEIKGGIALLRDVTAKKTEEEQTNRQRALLMEQAALLDVAHDSIIVRDMQAVVTFWNRGAEMTYGWNRTEAIGQLAHAILETQFPQPLERIEEQLHRDGRWDGELVHKRRDGTQVVVSSRWVIQEARAGAPARVLEINNDITARKQAEEKIRSLNLKLAHRNSDLIAVNKELESFSYSVAHDLRSPLRAVDGFSLALLDECGERLSSTEKGYLLRVREGAVRMAQLIDDMLRLSRITRQELTREKLDLSTMAKAALAQLQQSEPHRSARLTIAPNLCAEGDPGLLRIVLENLLGNAWKFTVKQEETQIEFGSLALNGQTAFFVRDNGAGFNMKYADKLFGAFQRLHDDSEYAGTGIGLATSQRIISKHGGRIWAESAVGKGATFYFVLAPAAIPQPEVAS